MLQTVESACLAEPPTLKDQTIVAANHRRLTLRSERTEPAEACGFERLLCFLGPASERKLKADNLAVMAVEDSDKMTPTVLSTVDVGEATSWDRLIHRPALVAPCGSASTLPDARSRCNLPLRALPPPRLHDALDLLPVHLQALSEVQERPDAAVSIGRMLQDQLVNAGGQGFVDGRPTSTPILRSCLQPTLTEA